MGKSSHTYAEYVTFTLIDLDHECQEDFNDKKHKSMKKPLFERQI